MMLLSQSFTTAGTDIFSQSAGQEHVRSDGFTTGIPTAPALSLQLADRQGLEWAQSQVTAHHYLHAPVDPRCSPVAYLVILLGKPVGCLIFGRPEACRVLGWYGSLEDVRRGTCPLSRWEVLNLFR